MAAKRREVDPADIERWKAIRDDAERDFRELLADGPHSGKDVLAAIAYRSVFPEPQPFDETLRKLIEQARGEKATWREITTAMGESSETRTQTKQDWRNRRASD